MKSLCSFALSLPLLAFFSCILLSIVKDFDNANRTHCGVDNILPSISASISSFYPQTTLWRLCIGIDSFPRYLIAFIYYNKYYINKTSKLKNECTYKILIKISFVFHFIELTALLLLTYISSTEIFVIHMLSFIIFIFSSTVYMALTILSYRWLQQPLGLEASVSHREAKSKDYKTRMFTFYVSSFLISLCFYIRHNLYCEPYVYSLFSFFEYLTVLANIGYHSIIFYDLSLFTNDFRISFLELNKID